MWGLCGCCCGWLLRHLLVDIETLMIERLVTLLFVLQ
jgi:hypothetical protein